MNILSDAEALLLFLPALARIGGMIVAGPLFAHSPVPPTVKAGTALFMTVAIWPTLSLGPVPPVTGLWSLLLLITIESLLGILVGVTASILFAGVQYAGQLIGVSMGLAIASIYDPISGGQVSVVSRLYGLLLLAVFFAADAHHILLGAILQSFSSVPVGGAVLESGHFMHMLDLGWAMFLTGIRIAAPILGVMFVTTVAFGFMVRTVPQMNVFIVAFPLRIGLGMFLLAYTLPWVVNIVQGLFIHLDRELRLLIGGV